jgi:hypothetical protein
MCIPSNWQASQRVNLVHTFICELQDSKSNISQQVYEQACVFSLNHINICQKYFPLIISYNELTLSQTKMVMSFGIQPRRW